MADLNKCFYCNNETTQRKGYIVCDNCKIIIFSDNIDCSKIKSGISSCLNKYQKLIESQQDSWHKLKQKTFSKTDLSKEEEKNIEYLEDFQSLRSEFNLILSVCISDTLPLRDKHFRNLLYQLLNLTDELDKILNIEQN